MSSSSHNLSIPSSGGTQDLEEVLDQTISILAAKVSLDGNSLAHPNPESEEDILLAKALSRKPISKSTISVVLFGIW